MKTFWQTFVHRLFFLRPRRLLSFTFLIALIPLSWLFLWGFCIVVQRCARNYLRKSGSWEFRRDEGFSIANMLGCPQEDGLLLNLTLRTCCLPIMVACVVACCAALSSFSVWALFQGVLPQTSVTFSLIHATGWNVAIGIALVAPSSLTKGFIIKLRYPIGNLVLEAEDDHRRVHLASADIFNYPSCAFAVFWPGRHMGIGSNAV